MQDTSYNLWSYNGFCNDHIITVDDDISYQKDLLKNYTSFIQLKPDLVYGLQGFNLTNGIIDYTNKSIY